MIQDLLSINFKRAERFPRSKRSREKLIPLVVQMIRFTDDARRKGILSLEKRIIDEEMFCVDTICTRFLKVILQMSVDGYEPRLVQETGMAYIHSKRWAGIQHLALTIILESVMLFQCGTNPEVMRNALLCWIGFEHENEILKQLEPYNEQALVEENEELDGFEGEFLSADEISSLCDACESDLSSSR